MPVDAAIPAGTIGRVSVPFAGLRRVRVTAGSISGVSVPSAAVSLSGVTRVRVRGFAEADMKRLRIKCRVLKTRRMLETGISIHARERRRWELGNFWWRTI